MAKEWTNGFYQSKAWKQTRDAFFKFRRGRCERCMREFLQGRRRMEDVQPGVIVHHMIELTPENIGNPEIALSFRNLELLCSEHHNREHKAKGRRVMYDAEGRVLPF